MMCTQNFHKTMALFITQRYFHRF